VNVTLCNLLQTLYELRLISEEALNHGSTCETQLLILDEDT
jgi:hypothetical protein